jgi:short-subunit dehydrogenase
MRLPGSVALVTGGSSGIGAAIARALAAAGARVLLAGQDRGRLDRVAAETGAASIQADLAAPDGPARLAAAARENAGNGIDVLVSNAGIGWAGPFADIPGPAVQRLVAVNLTAAMELTRLLVPAMADRGRGHVVFVSSIAGATGVRGEAAYAATKAGLRYYAESLRYELAGRGVGVTVVVPGVIDTPFFTRRGTPYDRGRPAPIPAERVARATLAAIEHRRAEVYVPAWMRLPARLQGAAPGLFRVLATRFG